jgi:hypothetical protein
MKCYDSLRRVAKPVFLSFLFCAVTLSQGVDPQPQDATQAILAAFEKYQVVGMGADHGFKDLNDFILSLIQNPAFPGKVNDIVVECGNRSYQDTLDRYIAGKRVDSSKMQLVWRNTTQQMCSLSRFYDELFPLVRQINQKLPAQARLRVVAADPPIDWKRVGNQSEYINVRNDRSSSITSVIERAVLAKKRRALLLFGEGHLFHKGRSSSVAEYEKTYPGVTFVVFTHKGFGSGNPLDIHNDKLEARMKSWPVPSILPIRGTWLADLDMAYYFEFIAKSIAGLEITDCADAYLYLGSRDSLHRENVPSDILDDRPYIEELNKRPWPFAPVNTESLRNREPNGRFYPWTERTPDAAMPLAKFVGTYTAESVATSIIVDLDHSKLVAKMPAFPNGVAISSVTNNRFRTEGTHDTTFLNFELAGQRVTGLTVEREQGVASVKLQWNP